MTARTAIPSNWRWRWSAVALATVALAGCSGGSSAGNSTTAPTSSATSAEPPAATGTSTTEAPSALLPVTTNPITNSSTVQTLVINSALAENNVDPASGATADDHLEVALRNTGPDVLTGFEVFYSITDPTAGATESYYLRLPDSFTIPAGAQRVAHFDDTGLADHFPVNLNSLYYLSPNPLVVSVTVSALSAAVQTATVNKDAGGPETGN